MRWRSVATAAALLPAAAGCNIAHLTARNLVNEPHVVWTQHAITHDLRREAKAAFEVARGGCPEHADSEAFRDGFVDGYVDYLDRGGNATLPAVPPAKYTRHKWYFTEYGQCLVKEYFLGFKLGQEAAIATGRRQVLTVPVLLPLEPTGPPALTVQPPGAEQPPPMIPPQPLPGAPSDVPPVVVPTAQNPLRTLSFVSATRAAFKAPPPAGYSPVTKPLAEAEGARSASLPEPQRLPILGDPPPLPARADASGPQAWGDLPAIPAASAPSPAPRVPTPELPPAGGPGRPVLPPNHTTPPPLPPNHPEPRE